MDLPSLLSERTRREVVLGVGTTGVAGCLSDDDTSAEDDDHSHDDHEHDDHDHDDHDHDLEEASITRFDIVDRQTDEVVADVHDDHWHGELPTIPVDDRVSLGAIVEDEDGDEIPLSEKYELRVRLEDDADDIVSFEYHGDHVHLLGEEEGESVVVFQVWHGDHADYETPPIDVTVASDEA